MVKERQWGDRCIEGWIETEIDGVSEPEIIWVFPFFVCQLCFILKWEITFKCSPAPDSVNPLGTWRRTSQVVHKWPDSHWFGTKVFFIQKLVLHNLHNVKASAHSGVIRANPSRLIMKIKVRLGFYFLKRLCVTFTFFFYLH